MQTVFPVLRRFAPAAPHAGLSAVITDIGIAGTDFIRIRRAASAVVALFTDKARTKSAGKKQQNQKKAAANYSQLHPG